MASALSSQRDKSGSENFQSISGGNFGGNNNFDLEQISFDEEKLVARWL